MPYSGDWVGVESLERFFEVFAETWESLDITEVTQFVGAAGVATSLRMQATARATKRGVNTRVSQFVTLRGDRIQDFTILYLDPIAVADAVCV